MRPVELTAVGFAAFRDRVVLDFDGVDFFALVGPTGAGKSSVIDAICFALYGSVPRYENRAVVAPAVTVGASEAKVSLLFDAAGVRYRATRVVRRTPKGGATTREARLERVAKGGGEGEDVLEVLAGTADELSERVEAVLGLGFDSFTRCVVLPQGEFARFLHDKPADRQQLLTSLLGIEVYARVGQRARQLAEARRGSAAAATRRLQAIASFTPEALEEARARASRLEQLGSALLLEEPVLERLARELETHRDARARAEQLASRLAVVSVPLAAAEAGEAIRLHESAVEAATTTVTSAEATRVRLTAEEVGLPALEPLETARRVHAELREVAADLRAADDAIAAQEAARTAASAAADAAGAALTGARASLEALRQAHSAAELATHLVVGEPCPVCEAVVRRAPRHRPPSALVDASLSVAEAERADKELTARAVRARAEHEGAVAQRGRLEAQRHKLAARVEEHPDELVLAGQLERARELRLRVATALEEEDAARAVLRKHERLLATARASQAAAQQEFQHQRDAVAELAPPPAGRTDLLADWTALADWAESTRPGLLAVATREGADAARAEEERRRRIADLARSCAEGGADVPAGSMPSEMRVAVARATATASALADRIGEGLAEAASLRAEETAAQEEAAVADALAGHLRATGFERWLVAEALDLLVAGASETLMRLSGGQYSLARDERNEFLVVDHRNADEHRPAKTLSGGETFQASLALALALADQLAGLAASGGAVLESIFLDEGFGTLDPEALSTVADTVEALGSDERMVGIVTHVRELADRVPVRFEVTKDARTSSVVRRSG